MISPAIETSRGKLTIKSKAPLAGCPGKKAEQNKNHTYRRKLLWKSRVKNIPQLAVAESTADYVQDFIQREILYVRDAVV